MYRICRRLQKLEEICRNYEKEEILKVLNSSMDLNLDEIELIGYDAFIQKVDEAGGILADVTEDEIAHINNYQLAMTGEALSEENKVTEAGVQELNGIQAAAYLQIRHFPGGYGGMTGRWKQVVWELLKKEGVNIENCYEQFFSGPDRSVYVEREKGNYLLCFQWEEGVKELHDSLFSGSVYQPSASVKELDSAMKKQAKEAVEDYRNEKSKIFSLFGMYIGKSPYMVSFLRGNHWSRKQKGHGKTLKYTCRESPSKRMKMQEGRSMQLIWYLKTAVFWISRNQA